MPEVRGARCLRAPLVRLNQDSAPVIVSASHPARTRHMGGFFTRSAVLRKPGENRPTGGTIDERGRAASAQAASPLDDLEWRLANLQQT